MRTTILSLPFPGHAHPHTKLGVVHNFCCYHQYGLHAYWQKTANHIASAQVGTIQSDPLSQSLPGSSSWHRDGVMKWHSF